jgi:hypothetical protein
MRTRREFLSEETSPEGWLRIKRPEHPAMSVSGLPWSPVPVRRWRNSRVPVRGGGGWFTAEPEQKYAMFRARSLPE